MQRCTKKVIFNKKAKPKNVPSSMLFPIKQTHFRNDLIRFIAIYNARTINENQMKIFIVFFIRFDVIELNAKLFYFNMAPIHFFSIYPLFCRTEDGVGCKI